MFVSHAELNVLNSPVGPNCYCGRPAAYSVSGGKALLPILNQHERQPQALSNVGQGAVVAAAVERDDGDAVFPGLVQVLQALKLRQARRRPRLPEIQQDVAAAQPLQRKLFAVVCLELPIDGGIATRDRKTEAAEFGCRSRGEMSPQLLPIGRSWLSLVLPDERAF